MAVVFPEVSLNEITTCVQIPKKCCHKWASFSAIDVATTVFLTVCTTELHNVVACRTAVTITTTPFSGASRHQTQCVSGLFIGRVAACPRTGAVQC